MSLKRIWQILNKELIQVQRDPRMKILILLSPLMQLVLFGYAITSDVTHVSTAVLDMDNSRQSRDVINRLAGSGRYFDIKYRLDSPEEIDILLDTGDAQMAVWIPRGFASDLANNRPAQVQVIIDGVDSSTASVVASYVNAITSAYSEEIAVSALYRQGLVAGYLARVEPKVRTWYNPELKSVNFLVPGVLAMILLVVTMMLTSLAVVREREIGTLEQLIVSPIRPIELMLGKVLPFALIGYVNVLMIVVAATLWFGVPIKGSLLLLLGLTAVFLSASLGLGLLVSTISRTQQQAMMVSFFIMQPSILLSGFIFPIDNMPRAIQWLTYAIPLRYYVEIVRGIFLRGVGLSVLWPQALALLGLGALLVAGSALAFSKKAD